MIIQIILLLQFDVIIATMKAIFTLNNDFRSQLKLDQDTKRTSKKDNQVMYKARNN